MGNAGVAGTSAQRPLHGGGFAIIVIPGFMGMMSTKIDLIDAGELGHVGLRASVCLPLKVIKMLDGGHRDRLTGASLRLGLLGWRSLGN